MYVALYYHLSLLFTIPGLPEPFLKSKSSRHTDFTENVLFVRLKGPIGVAQLLGNLTACIFSFNQRQHLHLVII
jgi:hypothetical protein